MKNPIKKIALILILIVILPALIFSLYEINTLSEREKVIEEIYGNQLDAILFSVNQYSEDVVSNWRSKVDLSLTEYYKRPELFKAKIDSFININSAIKSIAFFDNLKEKNVSEYYNGGEPDRTVGVSALKNILKENSAKIKRLYTYKRGGYAKIEPLAMDSTGRNMFLLFLPDDPAGIKNICIIVMDPARFARDVLGTKFKSIAENKFIITCSSVKAKNADDIIFATDNLNNQELRQKKSLWLIPGYQIGILLKGGTIEALAKSRSMTGLILILVLIVVLITGVYFVFRSIRKEMELARIKSDFVSNVSHELRTPLALISLFAETLEMDRAPTEEKKKEYYTIISKEALRLSRIVNKILSFSKIEAGKREYRFSKININILLEEVYKSYQFHLQNSGFKFSFTPGEEIHEIKADGEAISEAVINLIDNAIKYSTENKEIAISTGKEYNSVFIEVKDKGIGISEDDQKKIFDKFYRVSDGLIHNTKGTGLGLTLVKHIVDAHGGKIKVKSKPDEGSSFILSFPVLN